MPASALAPHPAGVLAILLLVAAPTARAQEAPDHPVTFSEPMP